MIKNAIGFVLIKLVNYWSPAVRCWGGRLDIKGWKLRMAGIRGNPCLQTTVHTWGQHKPKFHQCNYAHHRVHPCKCAFQRLSFYHRWLCLVLNSRCLCIWKVSSSSPTTHFSLPSKSHSLAIWDVEIVIKLEALITSNLSTWNSTFTMFQNNSRKYPKNQQIFTEVNAIESPWTFDTARVNYD